MDYSFSWEASSFLAVKRFPAFYEIRRVKISFWNGSEIWILRKKRYKKTIGINLDEIFQKNSRVQPFWPQKEWRILEHLTVEPADDKLKRSQIKLPTTCNRNEQQQGGRNYAEL